MYMDRRGTRHTPKQGDVVRARQGAFAIILSDDEQKILVTAGPHAPDVPELPGGGIDEGEDAEQAVIREIYEETNQTLHGYDVQSVHAFDLKFYADDANEYWDYHKTYFVMDIDLDRHFFEGKIQTPEGGYAWWMPLSDIPNNPFRATDTHVLNSLGYL